MKKTYPDHLNDPLEAVALPGELRTERPWVWLFGAFFGALMIALFFWPTAPLEWKMYAVVHGVCAQQHNIFFGHLQFPICARNAGIYSSFLLTLAYLYAIGRGRAGGVPPLLLSLTLVAFVLIMAADGFNSFWLDLGRSNLYTPDNRLRTITGMGMGISIAVMMHLILNNSLRKNVDSHQPILTNWFELVGIIGVNFVALVGIYSNLSLMFWPLAFIAFFGLTGVLYLVSLLLTSLVLGYEGRVTHLTQLARPATIALVPTLLILGTMASFRFWIESLGLL
ncbi:DUF2085 domain-containing protein [Candidatus Chloroploca sp. Khr17]|uniref:DUF2085 domain-containing protein n=1 Tax=Candidatus Chloroploca sp. Khr17 TaxID=2496869 RepID=UPI00101D3BFB|nr:DUF2085 domain-containing protein [Candidatus Chloroploca sp. Khr17]